MEVREEVTEAEEEVGTIVEGWELVSLIEGGTVLRMVGVIVQVIR